METVQAGKYRSYRKRDYIRRERFCRYVGKDRVFNGFIWWGKIIFIKSLSDWQSDNLNKMDGVKSIPILIVEWAAFDALRFCMSSKLQLLHWVPKQRVWNRKLILGLSLTWRPCRHVPPQRHACGNRLFAKSPMMRNFIKYSLNIFKFLSKLFSMLYQVENANGQNR